MSSDLADKDQSDNDILVTKPPIIDNDDTHPRPSSPTDGVLRLRVWRHLNVADVQSEDILSPDPDGDADSHAAPIVKCDVKEPVTQSLTRRKISITSVLRLGFAIRILLLVFCVAQDATRWPDGQLRFTDVDYDVFMDAAKAMINGDDIYEARPTYRYSPLIAAIVAPGHWLANKLQSTTPTSFFDPHLPRSNHSISQVFGLHVDYHDLLAGLWGKSVFILADLLCAFLQYKIILTYPEASKSTEGNLDDMAIALISIAWLFNPVTAVVSVRGNAEAVLGACILGCLFSLLRNRIILSGLLFGLCIHLKLYPVIYAPAIYLWLSNWSKSNVATFKDKVKHILPVKSHFIFGSATLFGLTTSTAVAYTYFGGMRFLHQAYFYHFTRVDIKHNFAPHFYPLYLLNGLQWRMLGFDPADQPATYGSFSTQLFRRLRTALTSLTDEPNPASLDVWLNKQMAQNVNVLSYLFNSFALMPSAILVPAFAFKLHRYPGLCWFATTYAFVTFNKVCTSQYFLWSLVLLPVALVHLKLPSNMSVRWAVLENALLWFGAQGIWLGAAYMLEMRTTQSDLVARWVWIAVWVASLLFVSVNVILLRRLLGWRRMPSAWDTSSKKTQ